MTESWPLNNDPNWKTVRADSKSVKIIDNIVGDTSYKIDKRYIDKVKQNNNQLNTNINDSMVKIYKWKWIDILCQSYLIFINV